MTGTTGQPRLHPLHRAAIAVSLAAALASTGVALVAEPGTAHAEPPRATGADPPAPPAPAAHPVSSPALDLNAATAEQLCALPGIGPTKAERIVSWRRRHGGFARVKDLRRVKGIGRKTLERLAPLVTVLPRTPAAADGGAASEARPDRAANDWLTRWLGALAADPAR